MSKQSDWHWWAGRNEEWLTIGPCETRDDAIAEAIDDIGEGEGSFHVMEGVMATLPPPDAEQILDRWIEDLGDSSDYFSTEDEAPEFGGKPEDIKAATDDLQAALGDWFARWALIMPKPNMFAQTRNSEIVNNTVDPDMLPGGHDNPRERDEA